MCRAFITQWTVSIIVTKHTEQNPWEANSSTDSQERLRILWNPNIYHRFYKSPPLVPVQSQINPIHTPHSILFLLTYITILSCLRLGLPCCLFPSGFITRLPAMARPQVVIRGVVLQVWKVAVKVSNDQSRKGDKVWASRFGVGRAAKTLHPEMSNTTFL